MESLLNTVDLNTLEIIILAVISIGVVCGLLVVFDTFNDKLKKLFADINSVDGVEFASLRIANDQLSAENAKNKKAFEDIDRIQRKQNIEYVEKVRAQRDEIEKNYWTNFEVVSKETTPITTDVTPTTTASSDAIINLIFDDVITGYISNEDRIYNEALHDLKNEIEKVEVRSALPYLVVLKLFSLYKGEQFQQFKDAFDIFIENVENGKFKRILRSRVLKSEEKMVLVNRELQIVENNHDFGEFLFYMLENYTYREMMRLHSNFIKVYNIRTQSGTVEVLVATERSSQKIKKLIQSSDLQSYDWDVIVREELVGGIQIRYGSILVDYSYREMALKFTQNESEVLFNERN